MPTRTKTGPTLLADIGGTNARFALYDGLKISNSKVLPADRYRDFATAAADYLKKTAPDVHMAAVAMAVAAPVIGDGIVMTNVDWRFSLMETKAALKVDRMIALNDFEAIALALPVLSDSDLRSVNDGVTGNESPKGVIGPGTGLGVASLIPHKGHWIPVQGEGGHVTLAPETPRESDIIGELLKTFDHVSAERVVSGPGLELLYRTIRMIDGREPEDHMAARITDMAVQGDIECLEATNLFCAFLGSVAGNFALTIGATGGIYIAGGIVPRLDGIFQRSQFCTRFAAKGRFHDYLKRIPIRVITHPCPAFSGLIARLEEEA
ncbi:MAG: glucokinase [Pseudomonadota bacterium]|nr:glucokinase [Pseudomonadota bacterium]